MLILLYFKGFKKKLTFNSKTANFSLTLQTVNKAKMCQIASTLFHKKNPWMTPSKPCFLPGLLIGYSFHTFPLLTLTTDDGPRT